MGEQSNTRDMSVSTSHLGQRDGADGASPETCIVSVLRVLIILRDSETARQQDSKTVIPSRC